MLCGGGAMFTLLHIN